MNRVFYWLGWLFRSKVTTDAGVLVLQPLPGIGDMVWHLPALNALAASRGRVMVMTKPRSLSDQLLLDSDAVSGVVWLERASGKHDGLVGYFRLVADLSHMQLREAWVMHGSWRYPLALYLAGVRKIIAPGRGLQKLFSDPAFWLQKAQLRSHPIDRAEYMLAKAGIEVGEHSGSLTASPEQLKRVQQRYLHCALIVLGIGSSEPYKQWGVERFAKLADRLLGQGYHLVLVGGPDEQPLAGQVQKLVADDRLYLEIGQPLPYVIALLVSAQAYVGNDTGVLNMALASGVPTLGLFGGSEPLSHVSTLHAIVPKNHTDGMAGISVEQVSATLSVMLGTNE